MTADFARNSRLAGSRGAVLYRPPNLLWGRVPPTDGEVLTFHARIERSRKIPRAVSILLRKSLILNIALLIHYLLKPPS